MLSFFFLVCLSVCTCCSCRALLSLCNEPGGAHRLSTPGCGHQHSSHCHLQCLARIQALVARACVCRPASVVCVVPHDLRRVSLRHSLLEHWHGSKALSAGLSRLRWPQSLARSSQTSVPMGSDGSSATLVGSESFKSVGSLRNTKEPMRRWGFDLHPGELLEAVEDHQCLGVRKQAEGGWQLQTASLFVLPLLQSSASSGNSWKLANASAHEGESQQAGMRITNDLPQSQMRHRYIQS